MCVEFIVDWEVNLENDEIMQKSLKELYLRKVCKTGLGCGTGISLKIALREDNQGATTHLMTTFKGVYKPVFF